MSNELVQIMGPHQGGTMIYFVEASALKILAGAFFVKGGNNEH